MPRAVGIAADSAFNPVTRDCQTSGCLPVHTFVGGNTWVPQLLQDPNWRLETQNDGQYLDETSIQAEMMLRKAASLTVTLTTSDTNKVAQVRVTNYSGHKLPTGYPEGRQMWLHLQAYDVDGQMVYESGAYDDTIGQLTRDADIKVYEAKQGMTADLAALLGKDPGESFHFVLNNMVVKDNRIPPQGYTQANYNRSGLRPVGTSYQDGQHWDDTLYLLPIETEHVTARLYYQTASREYIEFLSANGGIDGSALEGLWADSKNPPVLMDWAWAPGYDVYLPLVTIQTEETVQTSSGLIRTLVSLFLPTVVVFHKFKKLWRTPSL
jgi:hypothetical protein